MENFGTSTNTTSWVVVTMGFARSAEVEMAGGLTVRLTGGFAGGELSEKIYRMAKKVNFSGRSLP